MSIKRPASAPSPAATSRVAVTGGAGRWPMFDRHHQRLHVGDRIRYQRCNGPYGMTECGEDVITEAYYHYCSIAGVGFTYEHRTGRLIGHHIHNDVEHAHERWVEIIRVDPPALLETRDEREELTKLAVAQVLRARIAARRMRQIHVPRWGGMSRTHLQSLLRAEQNVSLHLFLELGLGLGFEDESELLHAVLVERDRLRAQRRRQLSPVTEPADSTRRPGSTNRR